MTDLSIVSLCETSSWGKLEILDLQQTGQSISLTRIVRLDLCPMFGLYWQSCKELVAVPNKNYEQNYQQSLKEEQQPGKFSCAYALICHTRLLLELKKKLSRSSTCCTRYHSMGNNRISHSLEYFFSWQRLEASGNTWQWYFCQHEAASSAPSLLESRDRETSPRVTLMGF